MAYENNFQCQMKISEFFPDNNFAFSRSMNVTKLLLRSKFRSKGKREANDSNLKPQKD